MTRLFSYSWLGMYLLCVALGMVQGATGAATIALMLISILFFLPPALLVYNELLSTRKRILKRIRWICVASLLLTTISLTTEFAIAYLYVGGIVSPVAMNISHLITLLVSAPLYCSQTYYVSIFLWACLLFSTFIRLPHHPKKKN